MPSSVMPLCLTVSMRVHGLPMLPLCEQLLLILANIGEIFVVGVVVDVVGTSSCQSVFAMCI